MKSSKLARDGSALSAIRAALAALPEGDAGLSAGDLAGLVGVHVTTVRFHLDRLARVGAVTSRIESDHGVGRPGRRYTLSRTRQPGESHDEHFQLLAGLLSESFRRAPDAEPASPEQVGERWAYEHIPRMLDLQEADRTPSRTPGEWLRKVGIVVDLLLAWGYDPVMSTDDGGTSARIRLRDCPFLELARADQDVICGTHRGLVRGALRDLGETGDGVELDPFTEPPLCLVQLTRNPTYDLGSNA